MHFPWIIIERYSLWHNIVPCTINYWDNLFVKLDVEHLDIIHFVIVQTWSYAY